jgi:hypothetical protein
MSGLGRYRGMFSSHVLLSFMGVSQILILKFDPDFKQKRNENAQSWNKFGLWEKM